MSQEEDIERRLLSWAQWLLNGSTDSRGVISSIYLNKGTPASSEGSVMLSNGECRDTDLAVNKLREYYKAAIMAGYLRVGPDGERLGDVPDKQVARALGCSRQTYLDRIAAAKRLISYELSAQRWRARETRQA